MPSFRQVGQRFIDQVVDGSDFLSITIVYSRNPFANQAEQLITDGVSISGQFIKGDAVVSVRSDDGDDIFL